ncbi:hypothetical protein BJV78DRAFT_768590 [Lactifluus subvellereus]|nr:hypothetical protein BJV78DRAFT_768590 [Lactifluus subvellereus]
MALLRSARREGVSYVVGPGNESEQRGSGQISSRVTIGALPDNVLLDIFDFYRPATMDGWGQWPWNRLVHVCQRWRYVMFDSPLRLDLCLRCTPSTPVREMLDVWPPFPIDIESYPLGDVDNVDKSLPHSSTVTAYAGFGRTI